MESNMWPARYRLVRPDDTIIEFELQQDQFIWDVTYNLTGTDFHNLSKLGYKLFFINYENTLTIDKSVESFYNTYLKDKITLDEFKQFLDSIKE
jgi:hypothetical protein